MAEKYITQIFQAIGLLLINILLHQSSPIATMLESYPPDDFYEFLTYWLLVEDYSLIDHTQILFYLINQ
jgi:hypothetical protein